MQAWQRETRARHVWYLRDRAEELLPWTNPTVLTSAGYPLMRLDLAPVVSLVASNATGHWRIEVRPEFTSPGSTVARRVELALASDGDVTRVAEQVVAGCVEEWTRTASATDASSAMRAKAAEQLEALEHHLPQLAMRGEHVYTGPG